MNGNSETAACSVLPLPGTWEMQGKDGDGSRPLPPDWKSSSLRKSRRQSLTSASPTAALPPPDPQWNPHSILGARCPMAKAALVFCPPCREHF